MSIHYTDPFAIPEEERSAPRRLRGRLPAPVTLWTAPGPAGLTVSSMLIADGEPGRVLGLIDDESDLWAAISERERFTVTPLTAGQQRLADRFAGLAPAPGGLFRQEAWRETDYGPILAEELSWAGCRLESARRCGYGLLVEGRVDQIVIGPSADPALLHHRGRYHTVPPAGSRSAGQSQLG